MKSFPKPCYPLGYKSSVQHVTQLVYEAIEVDAWLTERRTEIMKLSNSKDLTGAWTYLVEILEALPKQETKKLVRDPYPEPDERFQMLIEKKETKQE